MYTFLSSLRQQITRSYWYDLALVSVLASLALVIVLLDLQRSIAMLFTIPLVLIYPGYAMLAALFPYTGLDRPSRILLCVSLSVSLTILTGLAINRLPLGLYASSWAIALWCVTVGACVVAWLRRMFGHDPEFTAQRPDRAAQWQNVRLSAGQISLLGLALSICLAGLFLAQYEAQQQPPANTIQLWLLADEQGSKDRLRLGMSSVGSAQGNYKVMMMRDGFILQQWTVTLAPGQHWETVVQMKPGMIAQAIDAQVYREDEPSKLYRSVRFWLQP